MTYAKQSTAKTFIIGPILDSSGAAKTDEVVGSIKVTKNGTVGSVDAQDTLTHNHTGHYVFVSDGGDFDTLGEVEFTLNSGTNAMAPVKFQVIPANVYDSLVSGTDTLDVQTTGIANDAITAAAIADNAIDAGAIATGAITSAKFAAGAIDAAAIANNAIDAATFAADVDAEARGWLGLASANLDTQLADLPTVAEFEARTLVAASYATSAALDAVDNFVDTEITALINTIGVAGAGLSAIPWNASWDAEVQSECDDAITASTLMKRIAVGSIGDVTDAGTGTEVFIYGGVTATVTVDSSGNRSISWS